LATLSAGVLCDFAQVRAGLLFVMSGGVTRAFRPEIPAELGVMVGLLVEIPADEQGRVHEVEVVVKQNDTATDIVRAVSGVQASAKTHPGESLMVPAVADLRNVTVSAYGGYDVRVHVDGQPGIFLTLYVVGPDELSGD
jgi:hypothetical protein